MFKGRISKQWIERQREHIGARATSKNNALNWATTVIDYLFTQFLNSETNIPKDGYGGTIENRAKFLLQLLEKVRNAIGFEKVGVRLSAYNQFKNMVMYSDF